jgi:cytochrome c biogenesis protein
VAIHERWEMVAKGWSRERATEAVAKILSDKCGQPVTQEADGKQYFFVSRGAWARMGVYITHFSLFLFAVGAQIGVWTGMKGFANIPVGTSIKEVALRDGGSYPLGFEVRCDDFEVSFYKDALGNPTGRPKDYVSKLSVWEGGKQVLRKTIEVNDPLIYKGIYFYQSSYGQGGATGATFSVYGERKNLIASNARLTKGAAVDLEAGARLRLLDLVGDYRGAGPAVLVHVEKEGQPPSQPVILQSPNQSMAPVGEYLVRIDDVQTSMYTGLQVAKDPGVPVIWAGCLLITLGTLVAFFGSHRRVWARVSVEGNGARVTLAGNASRNRVSFERWFEDLAGAAKETFEK